ncbi:ubiquitin carboxyl-terminal hydrolase 16 [Malania oleifera]|uniref:ubiquitin carboxyl-terminal hydrolase 16 n=1 Tax=Malania oleifera TaxID=397392 RepID=UPI0025ADCB7E|nr:ubiquitin carboxyl-terminal hydrolase 16 [Malania oleifera]
MLVAGDLGFSCVVLVVLFFPVIGLVVRHKWRVAVARKEEIKRLLVFAAEEAARAELEATVGYAPVSFSPQFQCAVCYCPTTTRCARCKAVRYCSGKCQIVHWRQGHKKECHPPVLSESTHSAEAPCRQDGDIKAEPLADGEGGNSISKSSSTSFSAGFVSSSDSSVTSVDVSVNESSGSNCPETLDRLQSATTASDMPETPSNSDKLGPTKLILPEFSNLVDNMDNYTSITCSNDGETRSGTTSLDSKSNIDGSDGWSGVEPSTASSGFWGATLDSNRYKDALDDKSNMSGKKDGDSSEAGAFLKFSFNLSENKIPSLPSHGSKAKPIISCDRHSATSIVKEPSDGIALSEKSSTDISKAKSSPFLSSKMSNHMEDPVSDSHISKSRVSSSVLSCESCSHSSSISGGNSTMSDASEVTGLSTSSSKRSNHTPHAMKSREAGFFPTSASDAHLSSSTGRSSLSEEKPGKVDDVHACLVSSYSQNATNGLKTSVLKVVDQIRPSKLSKHRPNEIAKRYNDKGLFPYELFVKLYNWKRAELQPCGLTNCGNSCYANVVLQCLAFTPPLTAYLLQGLHSRACVKRQWCFTCEFEKLVLKAKEGRSPLSPIGILSQIGKTGCHLGNGREEDAHEFLRYVIDTMQSVCLKEAGINASGSLEEETSLPGLTFGGYLRSKIKCMKCHGRSERHERMMDLTVEIEGDIGSLEEALRQFTGTEILDGDNKYKCSRCKSYEKAKKKLTVLEAPNVLTIALKRFQSGKFGKLNKSIRFPEILDLAPYMSGTSDKTPIYSLYGVVVHLDVMNAAFSGHYVCYIKNIQNKWFKIDDSTVKAVDRERVLTKAAYMLLYARCSPRAPRSIRNGVISRDAKVKIPHQAKDASSKFGFVPPTRHPTWVPTHGPAGAGCMYLGDSSIRRFFDTDSSSDNSSLISGSDEGSCSTDSTRDSTSTDDFSDYIFGDLGHGWNSPYRNNNNSLDSDISSSSSSSCSSPYSRHSLHADLDQYAFGSPETSASQTDNAHSAAEGNGFWGRMSGIGKLNTSKQSRKFVSSSSSNSSSRETDNESLGRLNPVNMKLGSSFRGSTRDRPG